MFFPHLPQCINIEKTLRCGSKLSLITMKNCSNSKLKARNEQHSLSLPRHQESALLSDSNGTIKVRELDKRYTHANPKQGKCTFENCEHTSTHWLTRQNSDYCQSDMICHQHAKIWMQVRDLITENSSKTTAQSGSMQ